MAHTPTQEDLQSFVAELKAEIHRSWCSATTDLICALQQREIARARAIAQELFRDLQLCDSDRPGYFLSQAIATLEGEGAFEDCDELSVWLLRLEHELGRAHVRAEISITDSRMRPSLSRTIGFAIDHDGAKRAVWSKTDTA